MKPLAPLVDSLLQGLESGLRKQRSDLRGLWSEIAGCSISAHTKAELWQGGTLCVWVDNSVLASELCHRYLGTLLKRAQGSLGEEAVRKIVVRVGQLR